jgi:CDP-2,3-bis-(O-geranylgeranyl)-sn-glycerol synthase
MNFFPVAHVLFLVTIANGSPLLAKWLMWDTLSGPVDRDLRFTDGRPVFGRSKTIRGLLVSVVSTALAAQLTGLGWSRGALIAMMAMAGDLLSSFIKRRLGMEPSTMALGLDQIPESVFPALLAAQFVTLSITDVVAVGLLFLGGGLLVSRILYALKVRDRPY